MGAVFEKFQRERDEKIKSETLVKVAKVVGMLERNIEIKEIIEETGFSIEDIKLIQQISKK